MSKAGSFEIEVWTGGYPICCGLVYDGKEVARFRHNELSDLKYAVEKSMQEARIALKNTGCDEV